MLKNSFPLVSFVIPTRNRANVLRDCLESVVNQTYANIEVIVVNDNSSDNTLEVLKEYSARYSFFKYYDNDGHGVGAARNLGINNAMGEYVAFMDDDDICELNRIEEQMKPILASDFMYDFIISSFTVLNESGEVSEVYDYLLRTESIGFTVRWLVKKDLLIKVGGFDLAQPNLEEVELFFRLKKYAKIYFSTVPVVKVRNSRISLTKDNEKMIQGVLRLLELHSSSMGWYEKNSWLISLCKKYIEQKNYEKFKEFYEKLDKDHFILQRFALILSSKSKSLFPIKIYDKIYSKLEFLINSKNKTYPVKID